MLRVIPANLNGIRSAAKKGFFPSSIGLSFLVSNEARALEVIVRWGDYAPAAIPGADNKPLPIWQRQAREVTVAVTLNQPVRCWPAFVK